jgi:starch synthase
LGVGLLILRPPPRLTAESVAAMRVLFVSSEIYPLAKTGGLADVSAALPLALAGTGVDVRLLLPAYPQALEAAANKLVQADWIDAKNGPTRLVSAVTPDSGLPLWLLDCPALFQRAGGLYADAAGREWPDNARRYALFCRIAAELARGALVPDWRADLVHANDWHAGLVPLLLAQLQGPRPKTLFTIHNLAFQGLFPPERFADLALPPALFSPEGVEFYGKISFLKSGIGFADWLSTVSPNYAREIQTAEFGCGLDGLLQHRAARLSGILNGVDYRVWDPGSDPHLPANYTHKDSSGKLRCKAHLQGELGLELQADRPLVIYLSRVTDQKMADVVLEGLPHILERGAQFALLGQGDPALERGFRAAETRYPGRLAARIGYEEPLAHRFFAGADILLHPSRFEPCGLSQLYALRYGTLPIVRSVGGLADTVVDASDARIPLEAANGFVFQEASAAAMLGSLDRALALYRQPVLWRKVQQVGMRQDFGWEASARKYLALYGQLAPQAVLLPELGMEESARAVG